jgi:hypothetical protein
MSHDLDCSTGEPAIAYVGETLKQANAIMTTTTRPFFAQRKRIVELAGKYQLPVIPEGVCR